MTTSNRVKRRIYPYIVALALLILAAVAGNAGGVFSRADAEAAANGSVNGSAPGAAVLGDISDIEDAIRFRVLAHSNTVEDQWVKKRVKEAVLPEIQRWLHGAQDADEVRRRIVERLDDIQQLADEVLKEHGFLYRSRVTFGDVDFPAASYWQHHFDAGRYEALRITLGAGQGDNFWCIMFPPFCFGTPGTTVSPADTDAPTETDAPANPEGEPKDEQKEDATTEQETATAKETSNRDGLSVELRFFVLDWLKRWFA